MISECGFWQKAESKQKQHEQRTHKSQMFYAYSIQDAKTEIWTFKLVFESKTVYSHTNWSHFNIGQAIFRRIAGIRLDVCVYLEN